MVATKGDTIRCFVAIEIPQPIQELLKPVQTCLQPDIRRASWTKPGNFHLTLKFLGDVQSETIGVVSEAIQKVVEAQVPFSIEFGGVGAFPNFKRPRVLWVGIKQGDLIVSRLAKSVNFALKQLGFPIDNRFHPHLTLARIKTPMNLESLKDVMRQYDTIDGAGLNVNAITLMQSQLRPNGAIYTPLNLYHFSA